MTRAMSKAAPKTRRTKAPKPNATVVVDGAGGKYPHLAIVIYPHDKELALALGRAYLIFEATKYSPESVSCGAFAPCMKDEFDAPVGFMDVSVHPNNRRAKKLLQRYVSTIKVPGRKP